MTWECMWIITLRTVTRSLTRGGIVFNLNPQVKKDREKESQKDSERQRTKNFFSIRKETNDSLLGYIGYSKVSSINSRLKFYLTT